MSELKHTSKIKKWLESSKTRKWNQKEDNPNCFISDHGEAVYVYKSKLKIWEDIRHHEGVVESRIPWTKWAFLSLVKNYV